MNVRKAALAFGVILILTGLSAFVLPERLSLLSGARPYALFHVFFGVVGVGASMLPGWSRLFLAGFGVVDLYQALAQRLGWWPGGLFLWKPADFWAHVLIGAALLIIGLSGATLGTWSSQPSSRPS